MGNSKYSQINFSALSKLKKQYKEDEPKYKNLFNLATKTAFELNATDISGFFKLSIQYNLNKYTNYYIEDNVYDFLTSLELKRNNDFKKLLQNKYADIDFGSNSMFGSDDMQIRHSGKNADPEILTIPKKSAKLCMATGIIHSKSITRSIFFNIEDIIFTGNFIGENNENDFFGADSINLFISDGTKNMYFEVTNDIDILDNPNNFAGLDGQNRKKMLNLIINLFYYMDAFPDAVLNTPPDEVIDRRNKNNSKSINVSNDIKEYIHGHSTSEKTPHFRQGHFRYLGSDFYKNKKGQTVFIKPIFVGKDKVESKTIIETQPGLIN